MEPTYFTYSPHEMSEAEAYAKAKPFLAENCVIVVNKNSAIGIDLDSAISGDTHSSWRESCVLVRVVNGELQTVKRKGYDV